MLVDLINFSRFWSILVDFGQLYRFRLLFDQFRSVSTWNSKSSVKYPMAFGLRAQFSARNKDLEVRFSLLRLVFETFDYLVSLQNIHSDPSFRTLDSVQFSKVVE